MTMQPNGIAFVLAAFLALCATSTWAEQSTSLGYYIECSKTLGVPKEDPTPEEKAEFAQNYKCFMKCMGEKFKLLNNNQLNTTKIEGYITKIAGTNSALLEEYNGVYNSCKDKTDADACETASQLYKCVRDSNRKFLQALTEIITIETNRS